MNTFHWSVSWLQPQTLSCCIWNSVPQTGIW